MKDIYKRPGFDQPARYQIRVRGRIGESWSDWLGGMTITYETGGDGHPITTLAGTVVDQAALRGIMNQIWDWNLVLICATRIEG